MRAIIAQRLVRRICDNCKTEYTPTDDELFWLKSIDASAANVTFKKGDGCQSCNQTGYRGRVGVFELLEMTESMMMALKANDTVAFTESAQRAPGYEPLAKVALTYAKMGITTVPEVLKLVEMVAEEQKSSNEIDSDDAGSIEFSATKMETSGQAEQKPEASPTKNAGLSLEPLPESE